MTSAQQAARSLRFALQEYLVDDLCPYRREDLERYYDQALQHGVDKEQLEPARRELLCY